MTIKYYTSTSDLGDGNQLVTIVRTNDETDPPEVAWIPADENNADYATYLAQGSANEGEWTPVNNPDPAAAWAAFLGKVQAALNESDAMVMACYEAGIAFPIEWANYRKQLRALLKMTSGDPKQALPKRPADPEGIE